MATWNDVGDLAVRLPSVALGEAHEGSPAYYVGGRQFARLRYDDGREILQFWTLSPGDREGLARSAPETYWIVRAFTSAVFAWLDRLSAEELAEVLTDSWTARAPKRVRAQLAP